MKIYKKIEKRNEIEKQTGKASYSTLVDRFVDNLVLCNNILQLDEFLFDNIVVGEIGEDTEIYQAYIIDIANYNYVCNQNEHEIALSIRYLINHTDDFKLEL